MKSEKEKMLMGELYNSQDNQLTEEREKARKLIFEFNNTKPWEEDKGKEIIKRLINLVGSFKIRAPFYCDYGYNISLGNNFYANFGCVILDVNKVLIGDNVLLGPYVQIYTAGHPINPMERLEGKEYSSPITIGDNVWIGGNSIICPGVKIGDNVTIGAGSVVTKDIPSNVVAVGNPCKIIKNFL